MVSMGLVQIKIEVLSINVLYYASDDPNPSSNTRGM
jgi:hypothetical protein